MIDGGEEGFRILLKYYASNVELKQWKKNFPNMNFPKPEKCKYNRAPYLPKPQMNFL